MLWIEPDWPAPDNVRAISTLRTGGYSQGPYSSLNLGLHVGDQSKHVNANRKRLQQALRLPQAITWLQQEHGTRVVAIDRMPDGIVADGAYTCIAQTVCTVMTADCLPVLLCDLQGDCVASLHCGWRGLAAGILASAVRALPQREFMAWLGPAIGPNAFEVGPEVRDRLIRQQPDLEYAFKSAQTNRWFANLYEVARLQLMQQGIEKVYGGQFCTYSEPERFFSYRRDGITGRMATLIWRLA